MSDKPTITLPLALPLSRVSDLLCSAFEGGSNYWYFIEDFVKPTGAPKTWKQRAYPDEVFRHLDYPLNKGGALLILDKEGDDTDKVYRLDLLAIEKGLAVFAAKYPRHFADWLAEKDDATTGDVFLQCCLFGEAIYG